MKKKNFQEILFDIFCYDDKKRHKIEKSFKLKMTESEYKFFEDQKGFRLSKCVKVQEHLTAREIRFQQRCSSEVQFDQPSTFAITDNISLSNGSDSEVSSSVSCCEFYKPSAKKQKLDSSPNRGQYFYLAQYYDRYSKSDRAGAALASNVLMDHGIIEPNDTEFEIDERKLQRKRMRLREEIRNEELFGKVDGLYVDGKKQGN